MEALNLKMLLILTFGLAYASIFGYLAYRLKVSPLIGYLLAGYLIGPYSPGYIADLQLAEQLAEIGVVLMMFSVGMHFKWQNLINTASIAIPGAIGQTIIAATVGALLIYAMGWPIETGIIFGLAIGVASTVVLVRVLSENSLLNTPEGHVAVGWLIVEDIITVAALLIIPPLAASFGKLNLPVMQITAAFGLAIIKFLFLTAFMFTIGIKIVTFLFSKVMQTKSHELFTLSILAITFIIATGSAILLGTSIALGAFVAGMVIGQTEMRHKVTSSSTPLKDTFVVIFFLSIGMLFNPKAIIEDFPLFIYVMGLILIIKPLTAFLITVLLKYPNKTAIVVALGLAQIGEFSFILAEEALKYDIMPSKVFDIIVACSLVSIALNPLLFKIWKYKTVRER